jgi:putative ABC transport system permease protein
MLELRFALRLLRKQPVVTLTTLFALTVGIAVTTTGFTLLDSVIFSRLPFPNGDRFVLLDVYTEPEAERTSLDFERFRLFSSQAATLEHVGAFRGAAINLRLASGEVVPITGTATQPGAPLPWRPQTRFAPNEFAE